MSAAIAPPNSSPAGLIAFRRDPLAFFLRLAREGGDLAPLNFGREPAYLVSHPDLVREVLVTQERHFEGWYGISGLPRFFGNGLLVSQGEYHQQMRRRAQPAFHRERIAEYGAIMTALARRTCESWEDGAEIDLAPEIGRLTMAIVAQTLFSVDVSKESSELYGALIELQVLRERTIIPLAEQEIYDAVQERLNGAFARIIGDRRRLGFAARNDLLALLLDPSAGLNDEQIRDELLTIFLAGQETTAVALMWAFYLLSQHPEEERKLVAEFDAVLRGRLPQAEDLLHLPRTNMVLAETMRLYPPVWTLGRKALRETQLGRFLVPAGTVLILSQYVSHRDARFFPEPERFDPERWTEEQKASRPAYSYFPFSGGSRRCLGENFALMEGVLLLATIMQNWKLTVPPDHPIQLAPQITLRSRLGMPAVLSRR